MNTQSLYNQLKKHEITKEKFLYEVRRDQNLSMVSNVNSLADTINILKRHRVIFEEKDKTIDLPKVDSLTIDQVSPLQYAKGINYELDLLTVSAGQNLPKDEDLEKAQKKVLTHLANDPYYYTKKMMSDVEKKQEKENIREKELKKDLKAPNQMKKGKALKENFEEEDCDGCSRSELDLDELNPLTKQLMQDIIEEWGLTEYDLQDDDVMSEVEDEIQHRSSRHGMEEGMNEIKVTEPNYIRYTTDEILGEMSSGYVDGSNAAAGGLDNIITQVKDLVSKSPNYLTQIADFLKGLPSGASQAMRSETVQLAEAKRVISSQSSTLKELNLLNSKLLYVNKLFKSHNLTEGVKVKVVNALGAIPSSRSSST